MPLAPITMAASNVLATHPAGLVTVLPVMTSTNVTLVVTLVTLMPLVPIIQEVLIAHVMLVSMLMLMVPVWTLMNVMTQPWTTAMPMQHAPMHPAHSLVSVIQVSPAPAPSALISTNVLTQLSITAMQMQPVLTMMVVSLVLVTLDTLVMAQPVTVSMKTNALPATTIASQPKQHALITMVVSHANVMLDMMVTVLKRAKVVLDALTSMNVHLKQIHATSLPIAPTLMVDLNAVAPMVTAEMASKWTKAEPAAMISTNVYSVQLCVSTIHSVRTLKVATSASATTAGRAMLTALLASMSTNAKPEHLCQTLVTNLQLVSTMMEVTNVTVTKVSADVLILTNVHLEPMNVMVKPLVQIHSEHMTVIVMMDTKVMVDSVPIKTSVSPVKTIATPTVSALIKKAASCVFVPVDGQVMVQNAMILTNVLTVQTHVTPTLHVLIVPVVSLVNVTLVIVVTVKHVKMWMNVNLTQTTVLTSPPVSTA
jgi:hypothetical protein